MLPAIPNVLVQVWFDAWCHHAMRKQFNRLHLFPQSEGAWNTFDPDVSRIYAVNHSSFWDGIILNHLIRRFRRQRTYCMIDEVQVRRHPFFRRVGGFSVNRENPRDGLRAIEYAAALLNASPCAVLLFPQGRIEHNDSPLRLESGVARLIQSCPMARVVPVSLRYEFWIEQRAEVLIRFQDELSLHGLSRSQIMERIRIALGSGLDDLRAIGRKMQPGDPVLFRGQRSISHWKDFFGREVT